MLWYPGPGEAKDVIRHRAPDSVGQGAQHLFEGKISAA
jgi:hypothetical protein